MIYTCEKMTKLTIFLCVLFLSVYWTEQSHFLSKEHIKQINDAAKTWKAKQNFPLNTPKEKIVRLLGSIIPKGVTKGPVKINDPLYINYDEIPETFDARIEWQYCTTIGQVRNQGNCGSCWAHGTTGAFADRLCIATDGEFNQLISAEELTFCCHRCGFGCHGGYPIKGWEYFRRHGVVTGGNYNTTDGCAPYKIPPCLNDDKGNNTCDGKPQESHHRCPRTCYGNTTIDYRRDHHKTKDAYYLTNSTIQNEVIIYGPIEASFDVYDDFPNYESGVYMKTENASLLGSHSVKLIGWGVENDTPYWLMVNSWGEQWGDQGMFKIRRGTNECGIENSATAGIPLV